MAGHSKWANIQHRKGAQDKKRARVFGKLIRELTVAARIAGADPDANPRLRLAVDRARAQNMPRDTLERAIQRGAGNPEGANIEEVTYEGYGPGGAAVLVACMTDNRNRTVSEVRHAFGRHGGNLGAEGSVGYLFNAVGLLGYPPGTGEEKLVEAALEAGAEDVVGDERGGFEVLTDPKDFLRVKSALDAAGLAPERAEVTLRSSVHTALDPDDGAKLMQLMDSLDELDDVQNVYTNAELPAGALAQA